MSEFKVASRGSSNGKRDPRIKLILGEAAFVLFGMALLVYSVATQELEFRKLFFVLSLVLIIGALLVFNFYGIRTGFDRVKQDLVFVLNDNDLTRKRTGWPDLRIELSEIKTLHERPGWLTVQGKDPGRRIAIPLDVEGYDALRAELSKYASFEEPVQRWSPRWVLPGISVLAWLFFFLSGNGVVIGITGAIAISLLAWSSQYLLRSLRPSKRLPLWIFLGAIWVAALSAIYFRTH